MGMTWSKPYQNMGVTWSNFVLRFWVLLDMTRHVLFLLHLVDKTRLRVTESKFKSEFRNCNCKKKSKGKRKQDLENYKVIDLLWSCSNCFLSGCSVSNSKLPMGYLYDRLYRSGQFSSCWFYCKLGIWSFHGHHLRLFPVLLMHKIFTISQKEKKKVNK